MIWVAVSSRLFEAQDLLGTGLYMSNPAHSISHKRHSDGFMDDTAGYYSKLSEWLCTTPSIATVFQGLQNGA